jgi:hypothetical protein
MTRVKIRIAHSNSANEQGRKDLRMRSGRSGKRSTRLREKGRGDCKTSAAGAYIATTTAALRYVHCNRQRTDCTFDCTVRYGNGGKQT